MTLEHLPPMLGTPPWPLAAGRREQDRDTRRGKHLSEHLSEHLGVPAKTHVVWGLLL